MRLLDTETITLTQVADSQIRDDHGAYITLSHRWSADMDEISFEDMANPEAARLKPGYAKLQGFCRVAASLGYRYCWVDTCCINKSSSSELAEALNSMYLWYSDKACIAYLADVPSRTLVQSEWFDRGWTLQELVAPTEVLFYDEAWSQIGTRSGMVEELSQRTRIPRAVLDRTRRPFEYSVAQRMSWAARRVTKRVEDRAYSLMGLFDVQMPMIYGELDKAFIRLQQQLVLKTKDESVLAWELNDTDADDIQHDLTICRYAGIYASTPWAFRNCDQIVSVPGSTGFRESNGELDIRLVVGTHSPGVHLAVLNCIDERSGKRVYILVAPETGSRTEWVRVMYKSNHSRGFCQVTAVEGPDETHKIEPVDAPVVIPGTERQLMLPLQPKEGPRNILPGYWLRTLQIAGHTDERTTVISSDLSANANHMHQLDRDCAWAGIVRLQPDPSTSEPLWSHIGWLVCRFTVDWKPTILIANETQTPRLQPAFDRALRGANSRTHPKDGTRSLVEPAGSLIRGSVAFDWPEGKAILDFSSTDSISIPRLGIKVTVKLCRWPEQQELSESMQASLNTAESPTITSLIRTIDVETLPRPPADQPADQPADPPADTATYVQRTEKMKYAEANLQSWQLPFDSCVTSGGCQHVDSQCDARILCFACLVCPWFIPCICSDSSERLMRGLVEAGGEEAKARFEHGGFSSIKLRPWWLWPWRQQHDLLMAKREINHDRWSVRIESMRRLTAARLSESSGMTSSYNQSAHADSRTLLLDGTESLTWYHDEPWYERLTAWQKEEWVKQAKTDAKTFQTLCNELVEKSKSLPGTTVSSDKLTPDEWHIVSSGLRLKRGTIS